MEKQQANNGIGFPGALTIAFIVLKLTHTITWSWVWVLSPLWIGVAFVLAFLVLAFVFVFAASILHDRRTYRRRRALHPHWGRNTRKFS